LETSIDRVDEFGPPPIFPPTTLYRTRELPVNHLDPRYADQWPVGFDKILEWPSVWKGKTLHIDKFLEEVRHPCPTSYTTAIQESNYRGTPWRLHIDGLKASRGMPILRHGMVISYRGSNTAHLRYIIDHCIYQDKTIAYLKVFCFNLDQDVCEPDSTRPLFLLTVPIEYCAVRGHPNLLDSMIPTSSSCQSRLNYYSPHWTHFSDDEEEKPEVVTGFLGQLCKLIVCL